MGKAIEPDADHEILAAIEGFCRDVLAPAAADIDAQATFATCHRRALSEIGIMGLNLPTEFGGAAD